MRTLILFIFISVQTVFSQADSLRIKADIKYLSADDKIGRFPGSKQDKLVRTYIIDRYKQYKMQPVGGVYQQEFPVMTNIEVSKKTSFAVDGQSYTIDTDFLPCEYTANGEINAEVVFCGFGLNISQDNFIWNDYEGIDVRGKWAMVDVGVPNSLVNIDLGRAISHADIISYAEKAGAIGVLFIDKVSEDGKTYMLKSRLRGVVKQAPILAVHISRAVAEKLTGKDLMELKKEMRAAEKPMTFATNKTVHCKMEVKLKVENTANTIAVIEGSDPVLKKEYIVIGAHHDHHGMGGSQTGSKSKEIAIHNGADDNASGVAATLEMARLLTANKTKLKRSVIIMTFGAEEMGLLGSMYFLGNPLVDIKQIKYMLNFDMVGRINKEMTNLGIGGTGTAPEFDAMLDAVKTPIKFNRDKNGAGGSDHHSFHTKGIPVLFFHTGGHPDYHAPTDDWEKINYTGETEIVNLAYQLAIGL